MQQIITAKLKLKTKTGEHRLLRQTQLAYRDALNYVSEWSFTNNKVSSETKLHHGTYGSVRQSFGLPSQLACSAIRQVSANYKGLWTKFLNNINHRKAGYTKKRFKGLDRPPKYVSPTVTYVYGHDYGFKTCQLVSIMTLRGRIILPYQGYAKHIALIQNGARCGEARLWYDRRRKQYYLLVSLELEVPEPMPEVQKDVVGVDVGMRYFATTSKLTGESQFFSGKPAKAKADHFARLQKRLRHKGTRSATKRLIAMSGRERRFKLQANHTIAKSIVQAHPRSLIGMEDLTGIRDDKPRRKHRRRGKKLLPTTRRQRRANSQTSRWAFAELQQMIAYKSALSCSSFAIRVDADYTSKACPMCGVIDKKNRPDNGLLFLCQNSDCCYRLRTGGPYILHADLVGARNIAMRTLCTRHTWVQTGVLSVRPESRGSNVSNSETKAARLKRYAELRWSSDANPHV
jgi:IS605 OrfB family transposase